jgi:hypothetical protein
VNLPGFVALAGFWLFASGAAPPLQVQADLDGDGAVETAQVLVRGKKVRLEVLDAGGKRSAAETVPSPRSRNASVAIESGLLGSTGALLDVAAAANGQECRSVWRYRDGDLHRLPVQSTAGALPDCAPAEGWSYRWERTSEEKPAVYVRERTRPTEGGPSRQVEVFGFTGFALALDPARSHSEIRGVVIPVWPRAVFYHPQALEALANRFDFAPLRSLPRLSIVTDRSRGIFSLRLSDTKGEIESPVTESAKSQEERRVRLTAGAAEAEAFVEVELANGTIPIEARARGLGARFDHVYTPVTRMKGEALRVFSTAEEELASEALAGAWANDRGESYEVLALPGPGGRVRFGQQEAAVRIDAAPAGTDVLLMPANGSATAIALDLRGPNVLDRVPVRCTSAGAGEPLCESTGPPERLRRIGARMNLR